MNAIKRRWRRYVERPFCWRCRKRTSFQRQQKGRGMGRVFIYHCPRCRREFVKGTFV